MTFPGVLYRFENNNSKNTNDRKHWKNQKIQTLTHMAGSTSCGSHGACFPEGHRASAKPAHYLDRVWLRESLCCLQGRERKSRTNWKGHSLVIEEATGRREGESRWHHGDITVTSGTGETSRELCVTEKSRFHTSGQFASRSALWICVLWAAPCWHRGECLPLRKYGEMSTHDHEIKSPGYSSAPDTDGLLRISQAHLPWP